MNDFDYARQYEQHQEAIRTAHYAIAFSWFVGFWIVLALALALPPKLQEWTVIAAAFFGVLAACGFVQAMHREALVRELRAEHDRSMRETRQRSRASG